MPSVLKPEMSDNTSTQYEGIDQWSFDNTSFPIAPSSRDSIHGKTHWKLETIEPASNQFPKFAVKGQFPLSDGIKVKMDNIIGVTGSYGRQDPLIQWITGELETVTFEVFLFSRDSKENIDRWFTQFKQLLKKNKQLRRPPLCRFTFGSIYSTKCLVKGFGEVEFSQPKDDGSSRQIKFGLTLSKYKPYKIKELDRNKPLHYSRKSLVSGKDILWENIAAEEWGVENAIYGDRLRKLNRSMAFAAKEEKLVTIPDGSIILNEIIQPEFHGFNRAKESVAENLINKIVSRKNKTLVT